MGSAAPAGDGRCGALDCRLFATPAAAFAEVIAQGPLVLGIGETHAQQGSGGIPSATTRFTNDLLPLVGGKASDLILELWVADGSCGQREQEVAKAQQPVTEPQRESNQNEFVTLGNRAHELGLRPHVLRPSCEEYERIAAGGPDGVAEMLTMIARQTEALIAATLKRNRTQKTEKMIVAYGGAMHNDLVPREGHETWSFGPSVSRHTAGRYIELDLIVPEFIKDTEIWRALPWHASFDPNAHPDQATLFRLRPASYVLIFPRTPAAPSP
ncbi:MAG: hypothetical protein JW751_08260 [Polyangiaceae bacterium]|nr:hypothetical protein [Polyangiaceae bacterium]